MTIAEVGLKLIQDTVAGIKVGERGVAYVLDAQGRVIAHPDISLITADFSESRPGAGGACGRLRRTAAELAGGQGHQRPRGPGRLCAVTPLGWLMFVELPVEEAQ